MAFATRCPECQGKLVLDERPARGVPVECSHCGNVFNPPAAKPRVRDEDDEPAPAKKQPRRPGAERSDRPGKSAAVATPTKPKIKRTVRKKPMNPVVLLLLLGSGFGLYALLYYSVEAYLGKAGRATELMAFVPAETNHLRGVNVAATLNYPGYKSQVEKFITPDVRAAADKLAEACGQAPDEFLDYYMVARHRPAGGGETIMHLIRADQKLKTAEFGSGLTAAGATGSGDTYHFGANGPGILRNSTVVIATQYVVVIVPDSGQAQAQLSQSLAGRSGARDVNFLKHYESLETARVCSRGAIWLIIRCEGALADFIPSSTDKMKEDGKLKEVYEKGAKSTAFGSWATPGGGGVLIGAGFETADSTIARELRRYMQDGPLGNADESEPTNQLKQSGLSFIGDKRVFGEFMQYCTFKNEGTCAFLRSKIGAAEAIPRMMDTFANPTMGLGQYTAGAPAGAAGGGPGGQLGGPRGAGGRGP